MRAVGCQIDPLDDNLKGSRGTETHHLTDDITRLKRDLNIRHGFMELRAKTLVKLFIIGNTGLQRNQQHSFLRAAAPKINSVDGIICGLTTNEPTRNRN